MQYLTDLQKKFLKELGRGDTGRTLVEVLDAAKRHYSSIETVDTSRPTDPQIEGRKLFNEFVDELKATITTQKHRPMPIAQDNFE